MVGTTFYPRRQWVVPTLIVINIFVFLMWTLNDSPASLEWMENQFLVSWDSLTEGRFWTLLTAVFSHNLFLHILINMMVLSSFGSLLEDILGARRFLSFYLAAGVFSSFTHAAISAWLLSDPALPALGASGAISGLILLFSLLFPKQKILVFGLIPVPALWGALFFVGLDLWGLFEQAGGGGLPIGHGAHLGGAFAGLVYYFSLRSQFRQG